MARKKTISTKDFLNKRFGRLFVTKELPDEGYKRFVECLCNCGNKTKVYIYHLQNNHTQSCGCLHKERARDTIKKTIAIKLPNGQSPRHSVFSSYIWSAKKRKIKFNLQEYQFNELISKPCFYCKSPPKNISRNRKNDTDTFIYNGIDRVDNNVGYEIKNCVPCCNFCNKAKKDYTKKEFLQKIKDIYYNFYGN